jgi:chromosomal replication initiator protein
MVVKLTGTERVAEIQKAVTEEFQISLDELLHGTREERVAWPRQIAIALTREFTSLSMPVIAGLFGKKNHTSVIYAAKAVRKRCETEPAAVRVVNRIRTKIRPPQNCVPPDEAEKLPVAV